MNLEEEKKTNWKKIIVGICKYICIVILIGLLIGLILSIKELIMDMVKDKEQKLEKEQNIIEQANGNPVINNISYELIGYETKTRKNRFSLESRRWA